MDQTEAGFPAEVAAALERGRLAYQQGKFADAEGADVEAHDLAVRAKSEHGEVRALRFIGLCRYRRGHLAESEAALRAAVDKASALKWVREELLAHNHLGATLRKAGRLDLADEVFRDALERADRRLSSKPARGCWATTERFWTILARTRRPGSTTPGTRS